MRLAHSKTALLPAPFTWIAFKNFDQVLNNFYASYFAGALIIPRALFRKHIDTFLNKPKFDKTFLTGIKNHYNASPESLYQRLTNILPNDYHLENLFFLRFGHKKGSERFDITKELHLTHKHSPHGNETDEKYCRRWVSIRVLKEIATVGNEHHMDVQISNYPEDGLSYLIFASATRDPFKKDEYRSVSIGLQINNELRKKVNFLNDPSIKSFDVGVTCERCAITDCEVRQTQPKFLLRKERHKKTAEVVASLQKKFG